MTVYFAQRVDGGPIKIGVSDRVERRRVQLERQHAAAIEVLATIPGDLFREALLFEHLSEHRLTGEWFAPKPAVWRVVLEAIDHGELSWLLPEAPTPPFAYVRADAEDRFGGAAGAARALKLTDSTWYQYGHRKDAVSPRLYARFLVAAGWRSGGEAWTTRARDAGAA